MKDTTPIIDFVIAYVNNQDLVWRNTYISYCKKHDIEIHPARMPYEIPEFFINLLTNENDLVLDPFGGSNTTGSVAERLNRRWISIEDHIRSA